MTIQDLGSIESFYSGFSEPGGYGAFDHDDRTDEVDSIICPHCGYELPEDEYEQVCDAGCPCCRKVFEYDESL